MKKLIFILALTLLVICPNLSFAVAPDIVQTDNVIQSVEHTNGAMKVAEFTITADGGGDVAIFTFLVPDWVYGMHIESVEAYSATDDAFTILITSASAKYFTGSWTTATSKEEPQHPTAFWPIHEGLFIDATGITATQVVVVKVVFE